MTVLELAVQMHKDYRAASKALNKRVSHDHGWDACKNQLYFMRRARRKLAEADYYTVDTYSHDGSLFGGAPSSMLEELSRRIAHQTDDLITGRGSRQPVGLLGTPWTTGLRPNTVDGAITKEMLVEAGAKSFWRPMPSYDSGSKVVLEGKITWVMPPTKSRPLHEQAAALLDAAGPGPYTCNDCGKQYDFLHVGCTKVRVTTGAKHVFAFERRLCDQEIENIHDHLQALGVSAIIMD